MKKVLNYEHVTKLIIDEIERCPPGSESSRWFRGGLSRARRCVEEAQAEALPVVLFGVYEQVAWERDLAVQQLKDYGVGLGQVKDLAEVTRCKDCKYGDWDSKPDDAMVCLRTNDGFWRTSNDFCSRGVPKEETHEDH